jgi:hypothetical protein
MRKCLQCNVTDLPEHGPGPLICDTCAREIILLCETKKDLERYRISIKRAEKLGWKGWKARMGICSRCNNKFSGKYIGGNHPLCDSCAKELLKGCTRWIDITLLGIRSSRARELGWKSINEERKCSRCHDSLKAFPNNVSICDKCAKEVITQCMTTSDLRKHGICYSRALNLGWQPSSSVAKQRLEQIPRATSKQDSTSLKGQRCSLCETKKYSCDACAKKIIAQCETKVDLKRNGISLYRATKLGWQPTVHHCANKKCKQTFRPRAPWQIYCSKCSKFKKHSIHSRYQPTGQVITRADACKIVQCSRIDQARDALFSTFKLETNFGMFNAIRREFLALHCGQSIHRGALAGAIFACITDTDKEDRKEILRIVKASSTTIDKYENLIQVQSATARAITPEDRGKVAHITYADKKNREETSGIAEEEGAEISGTVEEIYSEVSIVDSFPKNIAYTKRTITRNGTFKYKKKTFYIGYQLEGKSIRVGQITNGKEEYIASFYNA